MSEKKYSKDHEWVSTKNDIATVGITNHAQESLGDIVFIELPEVGKTIKAGWDIMGEGYTTGDKLSQLGNNFSSEGLAFLKNKAFRTLAMLGSLPFQAFPGLDHRAHITAHLNFIATNMV